MTTAQTTPTQPKHSKPITHTHKWEIDEWKDGKWQPSETVQSWTPSRDGILDRAKKASPSLRGQRCRVRYIGSEDISDLHLELSPDAGACNGWPSYRVPDLHGEYASLASVGGAA